MFVQLLMASVNCRLEPWYVDVSMDLFFLTKTQDFGLRNMAFNTAICKQSHTVGIGRAFVLVQGMSCTQVDVCPVDFKRCRISISESKVNPFETAHTCILTSATL